MTASLPPIAQVLKVQGLSAHKKLGQHFLFDQNLTDKIVRYSEVQTGDLVFEIGPGPGGLTRSLLSAGANVKAIEADERFVPLLENLNAYFEANLNVIAADALKIDLDELAGGTPYRIVSNLPYNVGTALLIQWLTAPKPGWQSLTLMFQLEVANRIVAQAGDPHYGRLSILTAAIADAQRVMRVPASAFSPPPKVESAVVHLIPLPAQKRFAHLDVLARLTGLAFGQKRKMLRASLKPLSQELGENVSNWLESNQIAPTARPETLSAAQFQILATQLQARTIGT
jgi:16S rRNA (adenine1518-N6/adenine1519-N6)-dimethyltransferase